VVGFDGEQRKMRVDRCFGRVMKKKRQLCTLVVSCAAANALHVVSNIYKYDVDFYVVDVMCSAVKNNRHIKYVGNNRPT